MEDDKRSVDHVEKAYDVAPTDNDSHPEQDWTAEEEKAVVYASQESSIADFSRKV
jgi:hypothetical protein